MSAAAAAGGDSGPATGRSNTRRAVKSAFRDVRAPSSSRSSHSFPRGQDFGAGHRTAPHPQTESPSYLSGASTASSLSLPRGDNGDVKGVVGGTRSPSRTAGAAAPEKTPRKLRKATWGGGSRGDEAADLRKRYMYDDRSGSAAGTRATTQAAITPRKSKKRRGKKAIDGECGTPANNGGKQATRSTATSMTESGKEVVTVSCNADDGYDEDGVLMAAMTLLSSSTTVPNTPASPSPPPVTSDTELLRARYDRELLAILEEEQAAESAREKALAAAKARAKAAQARATYSGASTSKRRKDTSDQRSPSTAAGETWPVAGGGGGGDLQRRREEKAAVAAREEAQLKRELARERREASERVMKVSEEYEKALAKLASGYKAIGSSAEELAAG